jgi:hypothetical protein
VTEPGYPPRPPGYTDRSGRSRTPHQARTGWQELDSFRYTDNSEPDLPPWAVPGEIGPVRPARRPQRLAEPPAAEPGSWQADQDKRPAPGPPWQQQDMDDRPSGHRSTGRGRAGGEGSRAAAGRRRRSKRRLVTWGGTVVVIVILAAGIWYLTSGSAPARNSKYISTLQKGDLRVVPDSCHAVAPAVVRQYLNGTPTHAQPYAWSATQNECTFTVDAKPVFRELNIEAQVYPPSLTTPGNGSATTAATYSFAQQREQFIRPPKNTPQPRATIAPVSGVGDEALTAVQVFHAGGAVSDRVTVLARYRNVIITVYLQGQGSGGFGPVSVSELRSGALAVARDVMAKVRLEPKVG